MEESSTRDESLEANLKKETSQNEESTLPQVSIESLE